MYIFVPVTELNNACEMFSTAILVGYLGPPLVTPIW